MKKQQYIIPATREVACDLEEIFMNDPSVTGSTGGDYANEGSEDLVKEEFQAEVYNVWENEW